VSRQGITKRTVAVLAAALLLVALAGCARASHSSPARNIGGNWQLVSGTDATGGITPGQAIVTFKFDGANSSGRGPCNSFGATAKGSTTGSISIVVGIHTEMACVDAGLNATEGRYFAALDKVRKATLEKETLTLSGGGARLVFTRPPQ
jgi:heat shock protein HslJ